VHEPGQRPRGTGSEADPATGGGEAAADPAPGTARPAGSPVGRRVVLGMVVLGAIGVAVGKRIEDGLSTIAAHDPTHLTSLLPGVNDFRIYSVTGSLPEESATAYRLSIGGLVNHPTTLSFDGLQALPQTHLTRDFQCVTGWRVPNVHWSGVALPDLLDVVGVQPSAKAVLFKSFDGQYTESLSLSQARRRDVLIATSMLGGPVTREHGGPVRLYVAPMYGYKSCKWLSGITVADHVVPGYWENLGYDVDAWVGHSNGRTDPPIS
jgi:DMSO/TMAO reductase YedYZ molybdopterin-dependent catalytic subunit